MVSDRRMTGPGCGMAFTPSIDQPLISEVKWSDVDRHGCDPADLLEPLLGVRHVLVSPTPSENYTCMYMTLNIKRHINFLIRHIIY